MTNGLNFGEWVDNGHAPDYTAARNQLTSIGSRILEIQLKIGGPNSVLVNTARNQLGRGLNTERQYEGQVSCSVANFSLPLVTRTV